jgi:hypothetical protein
MYGRFLRWLMRLSVRRLQQDWSAALADPQAAQLSALQAIVSTQAGAEYARAYGMTAGMSLDAYRRQVPIVTYNELSPFIERMCAGEENVLVADPLEMFTITSGTTGAPKYLPITRRMNLEQHKSHRIWMSRLVADHPGITEGFLFTSVSPAVEGMTPGGTPYGSASGKNYMNQPIPVRRLHAMPYEAVCVADYEARAYVSLAFALSRSLSCVTSVNPSTLYLLGQRLALWSEALLEDLASGCLAHAVGLTEQERSQLESNFSVTPARLKFLQEIFASDGVLTPQAVWPELQVCCTWHGGNAPFYLSRLQEAWGRVPTRCLGLRASEGMFSVPLADGTAEGALAVWGHFMEFVPEDETPTNDSVTLLAHELEVGKRYRLIITTSGGLYRYDLGDIVEVTGRVGNTPLVAFLHKAGKVLSATGEKVTEQQVVKAMERAGAGVALAGFSVALGWSDPPAYRLLLEEVECLPEAERFALAERFDQELAQMNIEYEAKRKSSRLALPVVEPLPTNTYANYRQRLVESGRPEGQIKPPHLLVDDAAIAALLGDG